MPVPDFQSLMLPVLRALADGKDTPVRDVRERVASAEGLTDEDLQEMLPSGRQPHSRIAWLGRSTTSSVPPWWNGSGEAYTGLPMKERVFWPSPPIAWTSDTFGDFPRSSRARKRQRRGRTNPPALLKKRWWPPTGS